MHAYSHEIKTFPQVINSVSHLDCIMKLNTTTTFNKHLQYKHQASLSSKLILRN